MWWSRRLTRPTAPARHQRRTTNDYLPVEDLPFFSSSPTCFPTFDNASSTVSSALYFVASYMPGMCIDACDTIETAAPMPGLTIDIPPPMPAPAPNDPYDPIMFIIMGLPPIMPIVIPMYIEPAKAATLSADDNPNPPPLEALAVAAIRGFD